ncbi:hypothetical protein [Bradyrhizobium diazoefficiens]|uniref:hypothetical protein n=1 Tax=Bradyrhizobium diazoefficiens TaxID=1355477 RepID=UPI002729C818|nr:hypothetical protein [Bradyrhizobium diazoefficiens]WLA65085.1 hypothetical protein QNN01_43955 [Bradyrhizobium diazoefficiens]
MIFAAICGLDTLIDLMQPRGLTQFEQHLSKLDPDARRFFELKFNSKEFDRTKDQVVDRLFAVKRIRTLSRMFAAPNSKFDFFTEMGAGKVIVINVPQSLLQEDGVEIVGRFFISMILLAAHKRQLLPKKQRLGTTCGRRIPSQACSRRSGTERCARKVRYRQRLPS